MTRVRWTPQARSDLRGIREYIGHDSQHYAKLVVAELIGARDTGCEETAMAVTREFKKSVAARARREPAFAQALLDESATLFLNGEPDVARLVLRELINATIGFEALAELTSKPSKSLHRMLSRDGNPSMDNLSAIFGALRRRLKLKLKVRAAAA